MNNHVSELLPFYINQTLGDKAREQVRTHLAGCAACRSELAAWEEIARAAAAPQIAALPPLSPLVTGSLDRRLTPLQAVFSALHLIWSQRVFLAHTWLLPTLAGLTLLGALVTLAIQSLAEDWAAVPLLAITPVAAALSTAFLYNLEDDPASDLIASLPVHLATLLYARLTLALSAITLMGFLSSLVSVSLGQAPHLLAGMVAVWLGPMLLLSAFTTVLSLWAHPLFASGTALVVWGCMLILLFAERAGTPLFQLHLLWLVEPGWALFGGQVLLAGLLWLVGWLWLRTHPPALLRTERRSS